MTGKNKKKKPHLKVIPGGKSPTRYVNLTYDRSFKAFFFRNRSEYPALLHAFLDAMIDLDDGVQLKNIDVKNSETILEQLGLSPGRFPKALIHDIKVALELQKKNEKDYMEMSSVEMQRDNVSNFTKRSAVYGMVNIVENQPQSGEGGDDLNFNTCHTLGLCAKNITSDDPVDLDDLTHRLNINDGRGAAGISLNLLKMQIIEMAKCARDISKVVTIRMAWIYFLYDSWDLTDEEIKHLEGFGEVMVLAVKQLKELSRDPKAREYEQAQAKYEWDMATRINDHYTSGERKGHAEGYAEGHAEGVISALKKTALSLLSIGMSTEVISQVTGLDHSEIDKLTTKL